MTEKVYTIPCNWTMCGVMQIEADSLDEAIDLAYHGQALPSGEFVEDSFDVDQGQLALYNKEWKDA